MCQKATTYVKTALHNRQWQMSPTAQAILFAIADAHLPGKTFAVSYVDELITHHMTRAISKRTALRALAELKALGVVEQQTRVHVARGRYPGSKFTIFGYDPTIHIARMNREELGLERGHLRPVRCQNPAEMAPQTDVRSVTYDTSKGGLEVSPMTPRDALEVSLMTPRPIRYKGNSINKTKVSKTETGESLDQNPGSKNALKIILANGTDASDPAGPSPCGDPAPHMVEAEPFRIFGRTRTVAQRTIDQGSPRPQTPALLAPRRSNPTPLTPAPRRVPTTQRPPSAVIAAWKETHNNTITDKVIARLGALCRQYSPDLVIQADAVMPEITSNEHGFYSIDGLAGVLSEMHDKQITTAHSFLRQRAMRRGTAVVMERVNAATIDPQGEIRRRVAWHVETFGTRPFWDDEDDDPSLAGNTYGDEEDEGRW